MCFQYLVGCERDSSCLVPHHLCSSVDICCFHSPSHGGEEAMSIALCCLHKTSISSSLFSTASCIIFSSASMGAIAKMLLDCSGGTFLWEKKKTRRADIGVSYKCCDFMRRKALSVALSVVVDSYLEIALQTQ